MSRVPVYVAHPLGPNGPNREQNRQSASYWCAFLAERYNVSPVADWIILSGEWGEERREDGLACDRALVELVGTVVLCGPRISDGMRKEAAWAKAAVNLVGLDYGNEAHLKEMDQLMGAYGFERQP